jgi:hypothetical protein
MKKERANAQGSYGWRDWTIILLSLIPGSHNQGCGVRVGDVESESESEGISGGVRVRRNF